MKLEQYTLSKMCHDPEAARNGITKFTQNDFTDSNRKLFSLIRGLYQVNGSVDLHVLCSQYEGQGGNPEYATKVYHYSSDHTDQWQNVFSELKETSIKREIQQDAQEILSRSQNGYHANEIANFAIQKGTSWMTGTEKRYYSGKEVDELGEEYGEPIKTGFPIYDEQIYKYGGNRKGQMKGVILRQKHGKTRSACWEVAQNIRMGYKVLYLTLESTKKRITGNLKEVLRDEWGKFRENVFIVDGYRSLKDLSTTTVEAVLCEGIDKVVLDYAQLAVPDQYSGENEKINITIQEFRHLMIKHNFHCVILSQARKNQNQSVPKDSRGNPLLPHGWRFLPRPGDAYGSQELINACTLLEIGFRPSAYEENIIDNGLSKRVINPLKEEDSFYSLYFQIALIRDKPEFLHQWWKFTDSDHGLKNPTWL